MLVNAVQNSQICDQDSPNSCNHFYVFYSRYFEFDSAAFFDGNSSGQLTSRLTNDVGFMVTPVQTMLGTLVSNSVLLVGKTIGCSDPRHCVPVRTFSIEPYSC